MNTCHSRLSFAICLGNLDLVNGNQRMRNLKTTNLQCGLFTQSCVQPVLIFCNYIQRCGFLFPFSFLFSFFFPLLLLLPPLPHQTHPFWLSEYFDLFIQQILTDCFYNPDIISETNFVSYCYSLEGEYNINEIITKKKELQSTLNERT